MTERQIEAGETPCPLTRGEWLALLAAESQTMHGYTNLAAMSRSEYMKLPID
ncbi:MAG: hypothetical protein KAS74_05815 [Methanosarcinales archaeon]|nr:hypothetical protein [Methanosarcinales archaeon]